LDKQETNDVSRIWDGLGTFWGQFPDKEPITKLWQEYKTVTEELIRRKAQVQVSKYVKHLIPVLEYNDISHLAVFSGDNKNTVTSSGLDALQINEYTFYIPTLSGIETGQVLEAGTDYDIANKKYVRFLTTPDYDTSNMGIENLITLYANKEYRHNPVLWNIHASGIGLPISSLDNEEYLPYNIIASNGIDRIKDIANHYRYLIWGLDEMKRRPPTLGNLKTAFGISRGLAFTYRAGTVESIVDNTITVSVSGLTDTYDTYIIPSGYNITVNGGQILNQFTVLMSGIQLYDYVNNYNYITSLAGIGELNYQSTIVFTYPSNMDNLDFSSTFHKNYINSLIPAGLNHQSLVE